MRHNNAGLYGKNGVLPAKLALREGKKLRCMIFAAVIRSYFSQPSKKYVESATVAGGQLFRQA